jgi:hypothetical protein
MQQDAEIKYYKSNHGGIAIMSGMDEVTPQENYVSLYVVGLIVLKA